MRPILVLAAVAAIAGCVQQIQEATPATGEPTLEMDLELSDDRVARGETLVARATVTNVDEMPVRHLQSCDRQEPGIVLALYGPGPIPAEVEPVRPRCPSAPIATLEPGQTIEVVAEFDGTLDGRAAEAGTYTYVASFQFWVQGVPATNDTVLERASFVYDPIGLGAPPEDARVRLAAEAEGRNVTATLTNVGDAPVWWDATCPPIGMGIYADGRPLDLADLPPACPGTDLRELAPGETVESTRAFEEAPANATVVARAWYWPVDDPQADPEAVATGVVLSD